MRLLHLSVELMAVIVSYVTSETQTWLKLSCVLQSLQNIVLNDTDGDGAIWRSLTKETFRVTDEKFQNFPKFDQNHCTLFCKSLLPKKASMYSPKPYLGEFFFYGIFSTVIFVGELMIPTNVLGVKPEWQGQEYILKPVVSIEFDDLGGISLNAKFLREKTCTLEILDLSNIDSNVFVRSLGFRSQSEDVPLMKNSHCLRIVPLPRSKKWPPLVRKTKSASQKAFEYFTNKLSFLFPSNKSPVYLSRVAPDDEDAEHLRPVWDNNPISIKMVECLYDIMEKHIIQDTKAEGRGVNENRLGLTFKYIDGPKKKLDVKYREGMLRPGLYAGFYHRDMYGKYCKECLLIEYKSYTFLTKVMEGKNWKMPIHGDKFKRRHFQSQLYVPTT